MQRDKANLRGLHRHRRSLAVRAGPFTAMVTDLQFKQQGGDQTEAARLQVLYGQTEATVREARGKLGDRDPVYVQQVSRWNYVTTEKSFQIMHPPM